MATFGSGSTDSLREPLSTGLEALLPPKRFPADRREAVLQSLLTYTEELFRFNPKLGLVDATPGEFVSAHLLDSLAPLSVLPEDVLSRLEGDVSLLDVGSGAGLPGIPLAISFPRLATTLLDRSGRRCGFMRNAVAILGRRDIDILQGDLDEASRLEGYRESFDFVVARAFRPLELPIWRRLRPLVRPGGVILLYKGRRDQCEGEVERLEEALLLDGDALPDREIISLEVPGLERERTLLLFTMSA